LALKVQHLAEAQERPPAGIPLVGGINITTDPDVMSVAAFVSTSVSRKFRKSRQTPRVAPIFVLEGFLTKVGARSCAEPPPRPPTRNVGAPVHASVARRREATARAGERAGLC
jgi:hypothetical protein